MPTRLNNYRLGNILQYSILTNGQWRQSIMPHTEHIVVDRMSRLYAKCSSGVTRPIEKPRSNWTATPIAHVLLLISPVVQWTVSNRRIGLHAALSCRRLTNSILCCSTYGSWYIPFTYLSISLFTDIVQLQINVGSLQQRTNERTDGAWYCLWICELMRAF